MNGGMTTELPDRIGAFLRHLRENAFAGNDQLGWSVVAKMKADLMNARDEWRAVPVAHVRDDLVREGWNSRDVQLLCDLVARARTGRRLVPAPLYRHYRFAAAEGCAADKETEQ